MSNTITAHSMRIIESALVHIGEQIQAIASECGKLQEGRTRTEALDMLEEQFPSVAPTFWRACFAVHDGRMIPEIVARGCAGLQFLESLPVQEQKQLITDGIPVALPNGDHRMIPVHIATQTEVKAAIKDGHVLTLAEQRKQEKERQEKLAAKTREALLRTHTVDKTDDAGEANFSRWIVSKDRKTVTITALPIKISKAELREILGSME